MKPTRIYCWSCMSSGDVYPVGDVDDPDYACAGCAGRRGWKLNGWVLAGAGHAPHLRLPVVAVSPLARRILMAVAASGAGYGAHLLLRHFAP